MTRNEDDLRDALRELEQRADQHGGPSTASILSQTTVAGRPRRRGSTAPRFRRWLPPLAAAVVVAAAALIAVNLGASHNGSSHQRDDQAGGATTDVHTASSHSAPSHTASPSHHPSTKPRGATTATAILDDAAARLDAAPKWTTPAPQDFFYVHTTDVTTWTSVSGTQAGDGHTADGGKIWVSGCKNGQIVSAGESGTCTLNDVPHYRGDAPTAPQPWDGYLEHIAPGAKAAGAQGKIIVQVLHQDLISAKATAALLRYTASCPGLHTIAVRPVAGETLIGVTCTSMTNGSYGLAFDATSHAYVGFVGVTGSGEQDGPAEIVRKTGIVAAIGRRP